MVSRRPHTTWRWYLDWNGRMLLAILITASCMFWQEHTALHSNQLSITNKLPMESLTDNIVSSTVTPETNIDNPRLNEKSNHQGIPYTTNSSQPFNHRIRYHTCNILNEAVSFPLVPHFIIAGAQKSGTTAFMEFLNEHPQIEASLMTETHFFDWHVPSDMQLEKWLTDRGWKNTSLPPKDMQCALQKEYTANFNVTATSTSSADKIYFEKTPSYLFLTKVPELIATTCFWKPKIIVILRNPMDRALSHFRMGFRTHGQSFEQLIDQEIQHLKQIGLSQAPLRTEQYDPNDPNFDIPLWTIGSNENLEALHWKHYRKMFSNNYLQRGMYVTQLKPWLQYFPLANNNSSSNSPNGSLLVLNYEEFKKHPESVFSKLLEFVGATPFVPAEGFGTLHNYREDRQEPMLPETRKYLSALFRPYNELLADILGEEWRGVWD